MRSIYICSTTYQLIVALHIMIMNSDKENSDIIITDSMKDGDLIAKRLRMCKRFNEVFFVSGKDTILEHQKNVYLDPRYSVRLREKSGEGYNSLVVHDKYQKIFFANIGGLSLALTSYLKKRNKRALLCMYEEGVSSYSQYYGDAINKKNDIKHLYNRFLMKTLYNIDQFLCFTPDVMVWKPKCEIQKLESIESTKNQLTKCLNYIYDINNLQDDYNEKVIFFEESYVEDGISIDDLSVVAELESIYGKNAIFVKTHPRNKENRFGNLGYKTNVCTSIPWEVIALNINMDDKLLVSMTSTSVINSVFLLNTKAICVMEYSGIISDSKRVKDTIEVIKKIKMSYPDKIMSIKDILSNGEII